MQGRSVAKRGRYCTTGRCDDVGADLARAVVQVAAAGDVTTAPCALGLGDRGEIVLLYSAQDFEK